MANKIVSVIEIQQTEKGVVMVQRSVDKYARSVNDATKATKNYNAAQAEAEYKQSQGVRGTAAAGRSMSKLTQTIGSGPNGLVGAYATLAANAFAVSASFEALRAGAQVVQVLKGLELQGARTGNALTLTAEAIQDITQGSLSAADSMKASALGSSAGLSRNDLKQLTEVATNASLVLGRNIPDSMDRIIKGVTKLEPELLDELGLMTKLTEASENYARANNKSAASLTNFEKRRAFVEAIKAEGTLKYDGVAEDLGVNRLDQLGAAFNNLKHSMLAAIEGHFLMQGALTVLIDSSYGLLGALTILGAYVARQYTAHLRGMAVESAAAAKVLGEKAKKLRDITNAAVGAKKAQLDYAKAEMATASALSSKMPGKAKELAPKIQAGTITAQEQEKYIKSLESSNRAYTNTVNKNTAAAAAGDAVAKKKIATAQAEIIVNNDRIASLRALTIAQQAHTESVQQNMVKTIQARAAAAGQASQARASMAMEAAASGNLSASYRNIRLSVALYNRELQRTAAANAAATGATSRFSTVLGIGSNIVRGARVGLFGLGLGIKAVGIAISTALPWLGLITVAFSILQSVYESFFKSEETKKKEKALEALNTVLDSTVKSIAELNKVQDSTNLTLGAKAVKSITIQSNAMVELIDAYAEASEAYKNYDKTVSQPGLVGRDRDANFLFSDTGLSSAAAVKATKKFASELDKAWSALPGADAFSEEEIAVLKTLESLSKFDKELADSIEISEDYEQTQRNIADALRVAEPVWKAAQTNINNFTDAVKTAETAQLDFIKSISITTKFDNVIESFTALNSSIKDLQESMATGKFKDVAFEDLLTELGPSTRKVLDLDAQLGLDSVESKQKNINQLERERLSLQNQNLGNSKAAKFIEEQIKTEKSEISRIMKEISPTIIANTKEYEDQLRTDRLRSVQLQSMINLEQARLEKLQRAGTIVASDLRKQIDSQNRSKELQAQQVELETKYLEKQALKEEAQIRQLEASLAELELGKEKLIQSEELIKNSLILQKSQLEANKSEFSIFSKFFGQLNDTEAQIERINTELLKYTDSDQIRTRYEEMLDSQNKSLELARAQIKASRDQAAAIRQGIVSARERDLRAQQITIQNASEAATAQQKIKNINEENDRVVLETNNRLASRHSDLVTEINLIRQQAEDRKQSLLLETAANLAMLENQKDLAKGNAEQERELSNRITLARQEYEASLALESSKARLAIIQKSINLTVEEGINSQKQALSSLEKQADLSQELLNSNIQLERARARIAAKRIGTELDPMIERVLDQKAAEAEYRLAVQNHELRLNAINAEYDLLEAQRIAQAASLEASVMLTEAVLLANGGISESQQSILNSTKNAVRIMRDNDYSLARRQAIQLEKQGLERLRLAREEASIFNSGDGSALQGAMATLGTIFSKVEIPDPVKEVSIVSADLTSVKKSADAQLEAVKSIAQEIKSGTFSSIQTSLDDIVRIMRTTENSAAAARAATSSTSSDKVRSDLVTALGTVGSKFDEQRGDKKHKGIDIKMPQGTKIPATIEGRLSFDTHAEGGFQAFITAADGVRVGYAHLSKQYKDLEGTVVKVGDIIGESGGRRGTLGAGSSTGPHLHYSVTVNGQKVDPLKPVAIKLVTEEARTPLTTSRTIAEEPRLSATEQLSTPTLVTREEEPIDLGLESTSKIMEELTEISNRNLREISETLDANRDKLQKYGLAGALVFSSLSKDIDKLGTGLDEVGKAKIAVVSTISSVLAKFSLDIPNAISKVNISFDEWKTKNKEVLAEVDDGVEKSIYQAQRLSAAFTAASQIISGISSILKASSDAKIATIDKEIAAEEKRDGKSAQSVAKLDALEKKKDSMARKSFNTQKKLMLAQAVMSTAAAVAGTYASLSLIPVVGPTMAAVAAGIIGALGLAQVAIISGMQYESSYSPKSVSTPSSLSIGKRGDSVNLAGGPNANAGGEVGYLRGAAGTGTNASNYRTVGSAYGGEMMRGYGNRGFVVGEKGPEVINPETPISVTPANDVNSAQPINANISIQALDGADVKRVLVDNRGNIIQMLREAANNSGQRFLEDVNVNVYTRPNIGKL